ncbi:hypothetical protein KJ940_06450, partial [Myxococcota bacterium]|nr:hypothetical protein [Myxococcota bacterium]
MRRAALCVGLFCCLGCGDEAPSTPPREATVDAAAIKDAGGLEGLDAQGLDAQAPDAQAPDAQAPDAQAPDAQAPDAQAPDAQAPDAQASP